MPAPPSHPALLDPAVLAKLGTLHLRVRAITEGVLTGLHKSPHHGQSVEFAEHKEYTPGDDVRRIDWKAYGKFDKYYVKKYEQETNLRAYLVVDASGSMGWRGAEGRMTKLEYASALAASLAYLLVRQQDAAGLVLVQGEVVRTVAPLAAAHHLSAIVDTLAAAEPRGRTRLASAVDWVVEHAPRRSQVIVFSDLFDEDEAVLRRFAQLGRRKHEVTLFHVLDPAELEFPFDDPTLFLSMEDARQVEANGRDVRKGYLEVLRRWLDGVRRASAEADLDYALCRTDRPLDEVLVPFLARRERTALLAAIALAIARPRAEHPEEAAAAVARGPRATALVLDASASMGYRLGGRTLFERARQDLAEALAALGSDEPATVVVCSPEAAAPQAPSFDRAAVRRALDAAVLGAGYADLTACVATAVQALSASEAQASLPKRLVVATDLTAAAWRLEVPPPLVRSPSGPVRPEVTLLDAARGAPLPNAAVTGLEAEPDPAVGPRGFRFSAAIANWSAEARKDLPVQLRIGTGPEAKTAIRAFAEVPAGGTARKALAHAFPAGGPAFVTVSLPEDALPYDDARALAIHVPREVKALVVDGAPSPIKYRDEAYFVETALASPGSPVRPRLVDAEALGGEDLSLYDVVFLLNVRSVGAKLADLQRFVERGGGLFVSLGDQIDPETYADELPGLLPVPLHVVKTAAERGVPGAESRAAHLDEVAWTHPAFAVFTGPAREGLLGTRVFRYALAKPERRKGDAAKVLAAFDDGAPAVVEGRRGQGRVLLFTSTADRDWNDWPIRTSFLPAMQRFAAYLAGGLEERRDPPTIVGASRAVRPGEGQTLAALLGPDGRERRPGGGGIPEADADGAVTFAPAVPGLWQVKVQERGQERLEPKLAFAVWPDPRESDTRRLAPEELTAYFGGATHAKVEGDAAAAAGRREVPLWSILLLVGLAAFFLEGILLA